MNPKEDLTQRVLVTKGKIRLIQVRIRVENKEHRGGIENHSEETVKNRSQQKPKGEPSLSTRAVLPKRPWQRRDGRVGKKTICADRPQSLPI